jgi:hypothetical protein
VSCKSIGTTFKLALGGKIERPKPLPKRGHTDEYRRFTGEVSLLVWCTWRADGKRGPLSSSADARLRVQKTLPTLVGRRITDVQIVVPSWDLRLVFTGDIVVSVFCDHVGTPPILDTNWELWMPDRAFFVRANSKVEVKRRTRRQVASR